MTEQCNRCRFWLVDPDYSDGEPTYGRCRFAPPVLVQPMLAILMPKPAYGDQVDPDISTMTLHDASQHPVTEDDDWCGSFQPTVQPTSAIQEQLARWTAAYQDLDALDLDASEEDRARLWAIVDDAAERITETPAGSLRDVAAKLRVNLIHTISGTNDHNIVAGLVPGDRLSDVADLGERGIFAAIIELERGL
ncbi:hypothetical protein HRJ34_00055 [Rhizorhabdus wittichii]|uniref:Uncharacterized protein n=1 Tax=Rhizorhabdus wittichii TaxID=160791 RepID=A0A975D482_9SPHN|nr:hypothetical protein [Rhizorhabdus wittichii]QTH21971.1 hypothetical protein HRJ34_00055 [Rhizorhabdus wittichii]